ncbi:unnamed protein product [Ostreobium quekettii]|uniref:Uncharacterized protein n=1 Tax=Ostreobium quekettii TaxID=121088 RepID=A0A8S1J5K9_9CHLO|nr:unnamed protein product [Ostreobium quekettii]
MCAHSTVQGRRERCFGVSCWALKETCPGEAAAYGVVACCVYACSLCTQFLLWLRDCCGSWGELNVMRTGAVLPAPEMYVRLFRRVFGAAGQGSRPLNQV